MNRNVAVEAELSDSVNGLTINVRQGGHQLLALAGVKAGIRHGRFGFFGTSAAGVASFTRGDGKIYFDGTSEYQRVTHFALRQGGAVEFAATSRTFVRLDVAELLDAQFQRGYLKTPQISLTSFSGIPYHLSTSVTVSRRLGKLQAMATPGPDRREHGYSVGGLYATNVQEHLLMEEVRSSGGGGAWLGFPVWKCVSADAVAFDMPHDDHTAYPQDGGTTFKAFAGPKIGFRKGPIGLYAKVRPGIVRYSRTDVLDGTTNTGEFQDVSHPKIDFALDTGLVLEYGVPGRFLRHAVVRFEGGSTYDHYKGATLTYVDKSQKTGSIVNTYYFPPQRHSSLVFLTGFGYRF